MEIFKKLKKINLSNPFVFWRYVLIIFAVGLIIVFVGQIVFMLIISGNKPNQASSSSEEVDPGLDPKKASLLLEELEARPAKLSGVLASSTMSTTSLLVDPSL